jgi:hypothetical protein
LSPLVLRPVVSNVTFEVGVESLGTAASKWNTVESLTSRTCGIAGMIISRGNSKISDENLPQGHYAQHKCHTDCPSSEPRLRG